MSLKEAPAHVILAVDLIEILENNRISPDIVLAALPLIQRDFERKQASQNIDRQPPAD